MLPKQSLPGAPEGLFALKPEGGEGQWTLVEANGPVMPLGIGGDPPPQVLCLSDLLSSV